jgi:peroxygenase
MLSTMNGHAQPPSPSPSSTDTTLNTASPSDHPPSIHPKQHQHTFATSLPTYPATQQRRPWRPSPDCPLIEPGTPRANLAATASHPHGTLDHNYAARNTHRTVVQQHCDYFDTDHDGRVWPSDTYRGCRKWGWGRALSALVAFVIHVAFSYPTGKGLLPDWGFRIFLDRIHLDKHGSDSMTFDSEGRFVPQRFEDLFAKYDPEGKGGLTWSDITRFWREQRMVFDFFGQGATLFEWWLVYLLLWPEDGVMRKEEVRGVYDGSLFYVKAEKWREEEERRRESEKGKGAKGGEVEKGEAS